MDNETSNRKQVFTSDETAVSTPGRQCLSLPPLMILKVRAFTAAVELFITVGAILAAIIFPIQTLLFTGPYVRLQCTIYCLAIAAFAAGVPLLSRLQTKGTEWCLTSEALLRRSTSTGQTVEAIALSDVTRCVCHRLVPLVGRTWDVRLRTNQIPLEQPVLFSIFGLKITHSAGQPLTCRVLSISNDDKSALAAACRVPASAA